MRQSGHGGFCITLPVEPASAMAKSNYNDPLEEFVTVTSVWRLRVMARRYAGQARKEGVVPQGRTPWGLTARAAQRQELNDASVYYETHRALSLV